MPSVKIRLTTPVEFIGKPISEVELKEPNGGLYVRLGDPRTVIFGASGATYFIENAEVIAKYLDTLLVHAAGGEALLVLLSLDDALAVKQRFLSFFDRAVQRFAAAGSTTSASA